MLITGNLQAYIFFKKSGRSIVHKILNMTRIYSESRERPIQPIMKVSSKGDSNPNDKYVLSERAL